MIVFKDLLTGEEMFTDADKTGVEGPDDFFLTVQGRMVTQAKGCEISADLFGANPSQEEQEEEEGQSSETEVERGIDVVLRQRLNDVSESFQTKKHLGSYLKKWSNNMTEVLDEEKYKRFDTACKANSKSIVEKWSKDKQVFVADKEYQYFGDAKCSPIICVWSDDGMSVTLFAIKAAIEEEKC